MGDAMCIANVLWLMEPDLTLPGDPAAAEDFTVR